MDGGGSEFEAGARATAFRCASLGRTSSLPGPTESCSFLHRKVADFAYEVDRAGGDDQAVGWGDGAGLSEGGGEIGGGVGGDVESAGGGEQIFQACCAGIADGGKDDVVFAALGVSSTGVEEREEYLGHLFEVLVAEATEEKSAGTIFGKLGDRGAERPGAGGIVGYVEEEVGGVREGQEFETAGPFCVANPLFYGRIIDFVTDLVTICAILQ